jgi:hypothetical protein
MTGKCYYIGKGDSTSMLAFVSNEEAIMMYTTSPPLIISDAMEAIIRRMAQSKDIEERALADGLMEYAGNMYE